MDLKIEDFKDKSHLNTFGSIKATQLLAQYVKENYELPKRADENIWKQEMREYEYFEYDYYEFQKKSFRAAINAYLSKDVFVNDVSVIRNSKTELRFNINLDKDKTNLNTLNNYILGVHIYPDKEDISSLSEASKLKKNEYDQTNILLKSQENPIVFNMETEIRRINKIELFLFDKDGYDGVIGDRIVINDITFKIQ